MHPHHLNTQKSRNPNTSVKLFPTAAGRRLRRASLAWNSLGPATHILVEKWQVLKYFELADQKIPDKYLTITTIFPYLKKKEK